MGSVLHQSYVSNNYGLPNGYIVCENVSCNLDHLCNVCSSYARSLCRECFNNTDHCNYKQTVVDYPSYIAHSVCSQVLNGNWGCGDNESDCPVFPSGV